MDRGGRGARRSRGGRPFIRGYYRGRTPSRKGIRGSMSNRPDSRDRYESSPYDEKKDTYEDKSWNSPPSRTHTTEGDNTSPMRRSKWDDDDSSEKDSPSINKDHYNNSKYYRRPSGHPFRGQRRPYQNNYWERNNRGKPYSPQSQYRVRPYYTSPRNSRRYSRSPERHRSRSRYHSRTPNRYRSRSDSSSRSRRRSHSKHRSPPRRRSPSRNPRISVEREKPLEKSKIIKSTSNNSDDSDDFVEKLEACKNPKTPGRIEYSGKDNDEYWIENEKKNAFIAKEPKTPGRSSFSSRAPKTPGRSEQSGQDKDNYWEKSQSKNQYSNSWDDSPIREEPIPKAPKTPGRKELVLKESDDYWLKSSPKDKRKDSYSKNTKNRNFSTLYVQDLSSSDSEREKSSKQSRSMSITNSDKSDTPPPNSEKSGKSGSGYSQVPVSKVPENVSEPPPPSISSDNLSGYNPHWSGVHNTSTSYMTPENFTQQQATQYAGYQPQQPVSTQNPQWYQSGYQQYGSQYQQFQQFEQKPLVSFNPIRSNLEQVVGYQSTNQGLYNIDLKQVDTTKPPPNITPITPVPEVPPKMSQDSLFEMQRETYTTKLLSLKKELEILQIQYDKFKLDNSDGRHNAELKKNRKEQDDLNGKIRGVNNILEVLNTMIPKDSVNDVKKVESKKQVPKEAEYNKTKDEPIPHVEVTSLQKHQRQSISSSPSSEPRKKPKNSLKKVSKSLSSDEEQLNTKKSRKSKETFECNKKTKIRVAEKQPQFNYVYCDSCIHWCQPCNIFPKTAKEYLTHLHSESHRTTLEELNVVELPWHNTQLEPSQPEKHPDIPTKRVPIKGLEFFIGTNAWYCKLCDIWIGDLHCASAHFKSKSHNDLYAALIAKEPNWEIDWLTKRTRAFEKSILQTNKPKPETVKEEKPKEPLVIESKPEKSFFERDLKKERDRLREKDRDRDRDKEREREKERDREKYKKETSRRNTEIKNQLSPVSESTDATNLSLSDWMKPINLPVDKSMITLKESVQKAKVKLGKHKTEEIEDYKSNVSESYYTKKKKLEESKSVYDEKKEDNCMINNRSKIKLPFIGKMPFAKPIPKKSSNSLSKDVPNFTVETKNEELKEKSVASKAAQKLIIEQMIYAANEKKNEKEFLPVDMDLDDENENVETILSTDSNSILPHLNLDQSRNQIHQLCNSQQTMLPQDLSTALNLIFPCNEPSLVPCTSVPINSQINNSLVHQQNVNIPQEINTSLNYSPERKKKKNAPSQRKRRHMKKNMGKDEEFNKDDIDDDDKSEGYINLGSKKSDNIERANGNESEGDELAMLGIDAEDMAAQYY